jgi:hypothetical protein
MKYAKLTAAWVATLFSLFASIGYVYADTYTFQAAGGAGGALGGNGVDGAITKVATTESTIIQQNATTWTNTASDTYTVQSGSQIDATTSISVPGTLSVATAMPGGVYLVGSNNYAFGSGVSGGTSTYNTGGGGGGFGGAGGNTEDSNSSYQGTGGAAVALSYGAVGSGGGSGTSGSSGSSGAAGGGCVRLVSAGPISLPSGGLISAVGGSVTTTPNYNAGGGGSGGGEYEYSLVSITHSSGSTVNVSGGAGGSVGTGGAGGGGGGGFSLAMSPSNTLSGTTNVSGGAAGSSGVGLSAAGSSGVAISITGTPSLPLIAMHEKRTADMKTLAQCEQALGRQGELVKWTQRENTSFIAALESKDNDTFRQTAFLLNNGVGLDGHGEVCLLGVGDEIR